MADKTRFNLNSHTEMLASASTMAATRAARCHMPTSYIINKHPCRKFGWVHKRSGTSRELQTLKCWNVHSNECYPTRELPTLFCLPRNSDSSSPSPSSANQRNDAELIPVQSRGDLGFMKLDWQLLQYANDKILTSNNELSNQFSEDYLEIKERHIRFVASMLTLLEETCQFHDSLDAADSSQSTIDNSFYDACSGLLDIHSSTSGDSFVDGNLIGMDSKIEEVVHIGLGDGSDMKTKDLGENVNELFKVRKMKRSSHIRASGSGCYVLNPQDIKQSKDKKGFWFPYIDKFKSGNVTLSSLEVLHALDPCIVETRKQRIREVVSNRTYSICLVVEGLTDYGNISAVFRSADALGFQSVHVISNGGRKRYKQNRKVSMGSEKWLDIEQWETTRECFEVLWLRGYQIAAAYIGSDTESPLTNNASLFGFFIDFALICFNNKVPVCNMDWTLPTAIVLGNEHKGISDEALELSDVRCSIPMTGMVDSLNVSVAAGICMHTAVRDRISRMGSHGDLKPKESQVLTAEFYLRHKKNMIGMMDRVVEKKNLGEISF